MSNNYILVNFEKKEYITFLGSGKEMEFIGNIIPSKMIAYFLFNNNGDEIYFVGDAWQVGMVWADIEKILNEFSDVTVETLKYMIEEDYLTLEEIEKTIPWNKPLINRLKGEDAE